jgi:hypothetical protein
MQSLAACFACIAPMLPALILFLRGGLFGIKPQFRAWREQK